MRLPVKLNRRSAAKNFIGMLKGDLFKKVCDGRLIPSASLCVSGHWVNEGRNNFHSFTFTPLIVFVLNRRYNGLAKGLLCCRGSVYTQIPGLRIVDINTFFFPPSSLSSSSSCE